MQIKYTAIAAVVLALGAGAAQAKIALPAQGNGELFLSLYDNRGTDDFSDDKTLVVDLGGATGSGGSAAGRLNDWLSDNTTSADPVITANKNQNGYTITVLDQKVVDFLGSGSFSDIVWSVVGGDSAGRDRTLTTVNRANVDMSGTPFLAPQQSRAAFNSGNTSIATFLSNTNAGPEGDNASESTNASSLFVGDGAANYSKFGTRLGGAYSSTFNNTAAVGEFMSFAAYWENATSGGGNAKSFIYGQPEHPYAGWKLFADGKLVYSVPEPETYAMMAVGLLAIGAIARRRAARA